MNSERSNANTIPLAYVKPSKTNGEKLPKRKLIEKPDKIVKKKKKKHQKAAEPVDEESDEEMEPSEDEEETEDCK